MAPRKRSTAKATAPGVAAVDPATITTRAAAAAFVRSTGPFTCRGQLPPKVRAEVNGLLAAGRLEAARVADAAGRQRCGADLTAIFAEGPLDGAEHDYTCPACGNTGTYRAASFPALRAKGAA